MNIDAITQSVEALTIGRPQVADTLIMIPLTRGAFQPRAYKVLEEAIFVVRDRIAGLELFDHPETLALKLPKLVRSYGLDAIDESAASEPCSIPTSERFLQGIASAQRSDDHAVGLGAHIRLQGAA